MRKSITAIGLVASAAFLVWWYWPRAESSRQVTSATSPALRVEPVIGTNTAHPGHNGQASASSTRTSMKERLQEVMNNANRPISFFGKVVDQDGNPIPGVKVAFEIRYTKEVGPVGIADTFDYPSVTSDENGRFALTDAKGAVLAVKSLEKAGYEASEQATRGVYWYWRDNDPYRADSNNPKLFHMWRKAGAEPLVRKGIGYAIPYDGTPTAFDLLTGTVTENGDLRVALVRTPQQISFGQKNFEWTATIEVPDGGVLASADEQMYLAPVDGYERKVTVHMAADDPQWTNMHTVAVYLKLRGGAFYGRAKLEFMVGSDRETTPFSITSFVNPSGSRNLEYDPMQDTRKDLPSRSATAPPAP